MATETALTKTWGVDYTKGDLDSVTGWWCDLGGGIVYRFASDERLLMVQFMNSISDRTGCHFEMDQSVIDYANEIEDWE